AGIVGLSAAERLCAEGKSVVVLEALRVASQVTARSTAKVTSQHGLRYKRLIDEVGEDHARLYAQVNEAAIGEIEQLIAKEGIRCGFERKPAYLYTTDAAEASEIESGATVTARDVVVATHQPIVLDGKFFAKAFPFSHSVVAAPVEASRAPSGMCVTSGEPSFSFRD